MSIRNIEQGIQAIQAGNVDEGARLLRFSLKNPDLNGSLRALAYLWLAETITNPNEKRNYYNEALQADPNNSIILQRLVLLDVAESPASDGQQSLRNADSLRQAGRISDAAAEYEKVLRHYEQPHIRISAARALGEMRIESQSIFNMLNDLSPDVRQEALLALARIGKPDSKTRLQIAALRDESIQVRLYATIAFMLFENRNDILSFLNNLASGDDPVLAKAAGSLQLRMNEWLDNAPKHVFLSYARRDAEEFALFLAATLRRIGYSVWIDTNLLPGTPVWMREIEKAIQQAGVCVVILSPAVHESDWVPKEVEFAKQFQKVIIPIKYTETYTPLYLVGVQGLRDNLAFDKHQDKMIGSLEQTLDNFVTRVR